MPFITDASSLINLYHADALDIVCNIHGVSIIITPLVLGECNPSCAEKIFEISELGKIEFVTDENIPTDIFLSMLQEYKLGDGETESIAVAKHLNLSFCCDDRKARNLAKSLLGSNNVIGSLRLLKWAVEGKLIDCNRAFTFFEIMKDAGGFLPNTDAAFFCRGDENC